MRNSGFKELDRSLENMSIKILRMSKDFSQKKIDPNRQSPDKQSNFDRSGPILRDEELEKMKTKDYDIEALISSKDNTLPEWNEDGSVRELQRKSQQEIDDDRENNFDNHVRMSRFKDHQIANSDKKRILTREELIDRRLPSGMKIGEEDQKEMERSSFTQKEVSEWDVDPLQTEEARGSEYIQRLPSQIRRKMMENKNEKVFGTVDHFFQERSKKPKNKRKILGENYL